jgi:aminoglycoside phosphotransferase family enzyme/predicted kinase
MANHIQQQIFQAMASPDFYPHRVARLQQQDTHISKVFLTGEIVYKIKKAVNLGFLDFSTLKKRRHYCVREILLNRRLSHDIYLDVVAITRENGTYTIGGTGETLEYAVRMRQLPESRSLLQLIEKGRIDPSDMAALGSRLARFYVTTSQSKSLRAGQGWKNLCDACEENFRHTRNLSGTLLDKNIWETVKGATRSFLKSRKGAFYQRFKEAKIRDCHGDLRTDHIYFTDPGIQIIDCIEFNDHLRHIDVINDLAFLLMDLDFLGKPGLGDCLLDEFIKGTHDTNGLNLLAFYKCYRALVRCKVNCISLSSRGLKHPEREKIHMEALKYLDLAYHYAIQFSRPAVWVVCGMPATGKSTIAKAVSKALGIKVFRSDVVRKALFGLKTHQQGTASAGKKCYSDSASSLTYGRLLLLTQQEIETGTSVIIDATYSKEKYRLDLISLAKEKGIRPIFIECSAQDRVIKERLVQRDFSPSVSDARIGDFETLKARYEPFIESGDFLHMSVDTDVSLDPLIRRIMIRAFRIDSDVMTDAAENKLERRVSCLKRFWSQPTG